MSTEIDSTPMNSQPPRTSTQEAGWRNPLQRMLDNPVILKELRGRMRGRQAFVLLTIYLAPIALLIGFVYTLLSREAYYVGWDPNIRQTVGKAIFGSVILLELLLIGFIGPGLTSGAISSERERQTFDLLRTTLLSARSLVLGKLGAAFTYLFLLILTALPIQSLAFLLGGVGLGEMLVAGLMLVVTAIFFCTLGIFFSSFTKRTMPATLSSYGSILFAILITLLIFFLISYLESDLQTGPVRDMILTLLAWFLVSTNPFAAAIVSEVILVDEQSLFFTKTGIFGSGTPSFTLPSPWIIYVLFYVVLTVIMILISIARVKRPDR